VAKAPSPNLRVRQDGAVGAVCARVMVQLLDDSVGDTFGSVGAPYGVHISIAISA